MRKLRRLFWLLAVLAVAIIAYAYAGEVKLTTYYPAPYGEYKRIATKTLGVGDNDNSGTITSADAPDPDTKPGDVWIKSNLGIGTTSPTTKLHLVNDLDSIKLQAGTAASLYTGIIFYDSSNTRTGGIRSHDGTVDSYYGGKNYLELWAGDGGDVVVTNDATGGFNNFLVNGNIGIGTAAPETSLHVNAPSNAKIVTLQRGDIGKKWAFDIDDSDFNIVNSTDGNIPVTIANGGNVGIGTQTPQATLDITGTAILVPRGTSDPSPAINGMIYYNTSSNKFRGYEGGQWKDLK